MSKGLPAIHRTTAEAVAKVVGVEYEPWMQDWPLEAADPVRIEKFLTCYAGERDPDHRVAIAALITASLDDAFALSNPSKVLLDRARLVLKNYPDIVEYWSCLDAHTDDEMFHITPWIRTL
ncbi:MAG: hypothetical protein H0X66_15995 [Verrucomicrobia bacterium]|nr:hypothetical protein [Verrucomicrobiota bacterium]